MAGAGPVGSATDRLAGVAALTPRRGQRVLGANGVGRRAMCPAGVCSRTGPRPVPTAPLGWRPLSARRHRLPAVASHRAAGRQMSRALSHASSGRFSAPTGPLVDAENPTYLRFRGHVERSTWRLLGRSRDPGGMPRCPSWNGAATASCSAHPSMPATGVRTGRPEERAGVLPRDPASRPRATGRSTRSAACTGELTIRSCPLKSLDRVRAPALPPETVGGRTAAVVVSSISCRSWVSPRNGDSKPKPPKW
jgi:hypothetical protein